MYKYGVEYATHYIESTLNSPYTAYKSEVLASTLSILGAKDVWDLGGNVSGLMKVDGSLRYQVEKSGIGYRSLDLVPEYFSRDFAKSVCDQSQMIYDFVPGVIGDLRCTPLANNSLNHAVCADVIEHIDQPIMALAEIFRILSPGGTVLLVIPSLYKLDAIKQSHILRKRASTHENKLSTIEWLQMCQEAGFLIDGQHSRSLGIASGLLYLSWLNPNYVPLKRSPHDSEICSPEALEFSLVKRILCSEDKQIDGYLKSHPAYLKKIEALLLQGNISGIMTLLPELYELVTDRRNEEIHHFVQAFSCDEVSSDGVAELKKMVKANCHVLSNPIFLSNSTILCLKKPANQQKV